MRKVVGQLITTCHLNPQHRQHVMNKPKRNATIKELNDLVGESNKRMTDFIIKMMQDANIAFISFATSGNNSSFDIDITNAVAEWADEPTYGRVEAIYCDINAEHPSIIVAMHINDNALGDMLENGKIAYAPCDEVEQVINKYGQTRFYCIDELYDPTDALNQLMYSVSEVIDMLPTDRLNDNETFNVAEE